MPIKKGRRLDRGALVLLSFGVLVIAVVGSFAQPGAIPAPRPGPVPGGATLLPNGWRIDPAGHHLQVGDLPLNMVMSPDGRFIVITNNGWSKPTLTVFDTKTEQVIGRAPVDHAWLGLAWDPAGTRLFSAGAAENTVHEFSWEDGALKDAGRDRARAARTPQLPASCRTPGSSAASRSPLTGAPVRHPCIRTGGQLNRSAGAAARFTRSGSRPSRTRASLSR